MKREMGHHQPPSKFSDLSESAQKMRTKCTAMTVTSEKMEIVTTVNRTNPELLGNPLSERNEDKHCLSSV
jgi:ribosome biogenesis protein Nip4